MKLLNMRYCELYVLIQHPQGSESNRNWENRCDILVCYPDMTPSIFWHKHIYLSLVSALILIPFLVLELWWVLYIRNWTRNMTCFYNCATWMSPKTQKVQGRGYYCFFTHLEKKNWDRNTHQQLHPNYN